MKKLTYYISILGIASFSVLSSCDSNKEKTEEAESKLNQAASELAEAKMKAETDSAHLVSVEEWSLFKTETEAKIKAHEIRITYLKKSLKQSRSKGEKEMIEKIKELEEKNKSLKERMESYEKVQSDWVTFKREFAHDMDQLGSSLKDFTVPSK
ncbi:hypothetical protein [Aquirufa ecclesiirivi]|uniref:hypothetical protein n=1 Tax=Aquirufa ecclesiirivi TaxID=2715124 RepID=UPI003BB18FE6